MIFHILPWKIPNNFTISEIRNFYIDNIRTFIMWEETKVLLIEMDDSIIKNQHFEPNMQIKYLIPSVLTVDAAVDDIIQVGMLIYCLDTNGALYELKHTLEEPSRSAEEDMFCPSQDVKIKSFKFTKSIKLNGVLKLQALRKGFTLVKKQHDKGFLNIYTFQGSITKASKAFSIEIPCPLLKTGNVQCFLATHTAMSFEPKFLELLIGNIPEEDIEIVFMGLGSYVFILAVDLVTKQTPVLKLLFHSAHSVANILPLKGTSSKFCSHIAIIISTGSVVSVTPDPVYKSLEYATAYLPTHVATVCGVHDKILCGDKVDLWLCQIQGDTHVDMKCKMLPNKGVTAVCTIVGTSNAVAVTMEGIGEDVPRSLALYVGSYNLKMYFNPDCKTLTVLCTDLKILHAMKSYLLTLGLSKSAQRVVYIDSQLFTEAKQIEQELEPDKELLQRTLLSWRRCVSSYLPL